MEDGWGIRADGLKPCSRGLYPAPDFRIPEKGGPQTAYTKGKTNERCNYHVRRCGQAFWLDDPKAI